MTVKELRSALDRFPDDALVVLSKDAEGNGFSPLSGNWQGFYAADTTWFGSMYDERDIEECELDISKMVMAVVLTPTC